VFAGLKIGTGIITFFNYIKTNGVEDLEELLKISIEATTTVN